MYTIYNEKNSYIWKKRLNSKI